MSDIILNSKYILTMEALYQIGEGAGRDRNWLDILWTELIEEPDLMKEFMYYVDFNCFKDEFACEGFCLTDMYVFQMSRYNLIRDIGKNTTACSKEYLALGAFHDMAQMIKEPQKYVKKLSEGPGMDRY